MSTSLALALLAVGGLRPSAGSLAPRPAMPTAPRLERASQDVDERIAKLAKEWLAKR